MTNNEINGILGPSGILSRKLPHYEFRPQQVKMAKAVADALNLDQCAIIEAGTGVGKTLAYLIPALLSNKRTVVSTGTKNLQEQIYFKDIALIRKILHMDFRAVHMKGRSNYLCRRRFKQLKTQYSLPGVGGDSSLHEMKKWASVTETGDRSELKNLQDDDPFWNDICSKSDLCLGQRCEAFSHCFITKLRQKAADADVIIVNHHLFFADLVVKGTGFGEIIPGHEAVIFDEAHQLEEVATNYFGIMVSNYRFDELIRDIERNMKRVGTYHKGLNEALNSLMKRKEHFFGGFDRSPSRFRLQSEVLDVDALKCFSEISNNLDLIAATLNNLEYKTDEIRACSRRACEIKEQLAFIIRMGDAEFVYWRENRGRGVFLHASPIDVSQELKTRLFDGTKGIILTSATISTNRGFSYFRERLGLEGDVVELALSSYFDYKRQSILYLPKNMPYPNEPEFIESISEEIERILSITSGRAFVLFTSFRNMKEVHYILRERLPFPIYLQGERPKSHLLAQFKKDVSSVLFATQSFWEGIDVQGESLSCVIIDKLPFASPSEPIVEARIEEMSRKDRNPFLDYQLPSAIVILKQGMGRLIRNKRDRGVFAILDGRILTRHYGRTIVQSLPNCLVTNSLQDVGQFFAVPVRNI